MFLILILHVCHADIYITQVVRKLYIIDALRNLKLVLCFSK